MSKKTTDSLKDLKILLSKTKVDLCKKLNDIKLNNKEISYKKANIDKKFEYYIAKAVLVQSSDKDLSKWVVSYEIYQFTSPEGNSVYRAAFTKQEAKDFMELASTATRKQTADGGFSFFYEHVNTPEDIAKAERYLAYQAKLEKAQCEFWKAPYELLSEHCGSNQHIDL